MNRNEAKKLAPIIKAFGDGEDVQYYSMDRHWITADEEYNPVFDSTVKWRIKPEPREFWIPGNDEGWMKRNAMTNEEKEKADWGNSWIKVREVIE